MNKLIEEFKHFCNQKQDIILVHPKEILDWINQNYISKEEILNLECLKEERLLKLENWQIPMIIVREIKEEITKDLFKDFKQVSNPLEVEKYENSNR